MYKAKILEKTKDAWGTLRMGVFKDDEQIGEYDRRYHSHGESTFFPFQHPNGQWYALYSADYTCTYIMSLPDCKKIGGEEGAAGGFCPVEYFVPTYWEWLIKGQTEEQMKKDKIPEANWHWVGRDRISKQYSDTLPKSEDDDEFKWGRELIYDVNLGFVAGCVWGDDSGGWKLQHLDLNKAPEGILVRKETFGYIELPENLSLKEAVHITDFDDFVDDRQHRTRVTIDVQKHHHLTGAELKKAFPVGE